LALSEADRKLAASLLLLDLNRHRAKGSYKVRIETRWRTTRVATNNEGKNSMKEKKRRSILDRSDLLIENAVYFGTSPVGSMLSAEKATILTDDSAC